MNRLFSALLSTLIITASCSKIDRENDDNKIKGKEIWLSYHNNKIPDECINYYIERDLQSTERSKKNIEEATKIATEKAGLFYAIIVAANEAVDAREKVYNTVIEGVEKGFETPKARKDAFMELHDLKTSVSFTVYKPEYDHNGCNFEEAVKNFGTKMPESSPSIEDYYLKYSE